MCIVVQLDQMREFDPSPGDCRQSASRRPCDSAGSPCACAPFAACICKSWRPAFLLSISCLLVTLFPAVHFLSADETLPVSPPTFTLSIPNDLTVLPSLSTMVEVPVMLEQNDSENGSGGYDLLQIGLLAITRT